MIRNGLLYITPQAAAAEADLLAASPAVTLVEAKSGPSAGIKFTHFRWDAEPYGDKWMAWQARSVYT